MSSILSAQGMVLATAMAVSGTVIVLAACRLQKSSPSSTDHPHFQLLSDQQLPPSCIISSGKKKEKKKKKRVHFAEDVVDPIGNGDEYRKLHSNNNNNSCNNNNNSTIKYSNTLKKGRSKMPANRVALYNGILRDRVVHRVAYT